MKKAIAILFFILISSLVHAASYKQSFEYWRTTSPATATLPVWGIVTSSPTMIFRLTVSSACSGSSFRFFNASTTVNIISTSPYYDLSGSAGNNLQQIEIKQPLSAGFTLSVTSGTAGCVPQFSLEYDYIYALPKGKENYGRY